MDMKKSSIHPDNSSTVQAWNNTEEGVVKIPEFSQASQNVVAQPSQQSTSSTENSLNNQKNNMLVKKLTENEVTYI
jgi:hypothetical protein